MKQDNVITIWYFNYSDTYWADGTAQWSKARHFLDVLKDNFMCQMGEDSGKTNALLELLFKNNTDLITDVVAKDNF